MRYSVLNIEIDYQKIGVDNGGYQPTMSVYLPDNSKEMNIDRKRPTIVVCPGGGYGYTSAREAEPIALKFLSVGFNAVVVHYSVAPATFPAALYELSYAVSKVRENAEEWNVDTNKIVVIGFSAGGHLAASLGVFWNKDFVKEYFGFKGGENKPNGMILSYPVISSGEKAHRGSFNNLLGEKANDAEMLELVSLEKQVSEDTPPAFIWHTFNDACVPVENTLAMATALREKDIPFEMHIYPDGPHGLSLANDVVYGSYGGGYEHMQPWIDMAIRWVKDL